ncbi:hypothetical protein CYMTET_41344 [Cymbomonas tetramitiformis]|uniref:Uncharacterized protein n=1 Tax=Cymbomonas tetramitiformis TaxID=36881 RepID=A0AAE0C6B7_9CHLO|nr:hypothetical protein CYMTET_41344 [Cymbomonas tetramitiformis]
MKRFAKEGKDEANRVRLQAYIMASEGRDWKGLYFFVTTSATLTVFYSTQRPSFSLQGVKMWLASFANTNNFQYVMFSFIFNGGAPVAVALLPICCCCLYQWMTYVNKHYADNSLWQRFGSKTFETLQTNMTSALQLCATVEIAIAFFLIFELFTPKRSPLRLLMYWNFLRLRFHCGDNTVLRIKFTHLNTASYQRQVWTMIDSYVQPVFTRVPQLQPVADMAKKWFRGY